jgi:hypothetical protein
MVMSFISRRMLQLHCHCKSLFILFMYSALGFVTKVSEVSFVNSFRNVKVSNLECVFVSRYMVDF